MGKYVCYGLSDGSFTWGRIKAEATVNTPNGPKEVFILTDRMTCRVPRGELERRAVARLGRQISAGKAGPMALPGNTDPSTLPDYQKAGYGAKALPSGSGQNEPSNLPVKREQMCPMLPEKHGIPELSEIMDIEKSDGLPMYQKVASVQSSSDPLRAIDYVFRKFGYDTNVRKDQLNLDEESGDVIDRQILGLEDLTDDELFLLVMRRKISGIGLNQGARNMLALGLSPIPESEIEGKAVALLKERKNVKSE